MGLTIAYDSAILTLEASAEPILDVASGPLALMSCGASFFARLD
jgi:hypothetical protein